MAIIILIIIMILDIKYMILPNIKWEEINNMKNLNPNLIVEIKSLIMKNNNIPNTYVIDAIQMLIFYRTKEFKMYSECEEIYNNLI